MPDRRFALYEGEDLLEDKLVSLAWAQRVAEIRDEKRGVTVRWTKTFGRAHGKRSDGSPGWRIEAMTSG